MSGGDPLLLAKNLILGIVYYATTSRIKTSKEIENLLSFLDSSGVDIVQLSSIVPTGRGMFASSCRFSEKGLEEAIERLKISIPGLREDIPDSEGLVLSSATWQ